MTSYRAVEQKINTHAIAKTSLMVVELCCNIFVVILHYNSPISIGPVCCSFTNRVHLFVRCNTERHKLQSMLGNITTSDDVTLSLSLSIALFRSTVDPFSVPIDSIRNSIHCIRSLAHIYRPETKLAPTSIPPVEPPTLRAFEPAPDSFVYSLQPVACRRRVVTPNSCRRSSVLFGPSITETQRVSAVCCLVVRLCCWFSDVSRV